MTYSPALVIFLSLLVDAIVGDPTFALHPVRLLGGFASRAEAWTRRFFAPSRLRLAGFLSWLTVCFVASVAAYSICRIGRILGPIPRIAAEVFVLWASIAPADLARHALRVRRALLADRRNGSAEPLEGRKAVAMIVGRRVDTLSTPEVARAAVESVAESSIDGVAAPLFWACVLGPWAAFLYRAVNTMDSMFGHKNDRYLLFGFFPAKSDDAANWLPARLSSLVACLAAPFLGLSLGGSLRSFAKYRLAQACPNAGHPEAAYAGALGVSLGGPVRYEEGIEDKPFMNPQGREPEAQDIRRAVRLMYLQTVATAALFLTLRWSAVEAAKWAAGLIPW